MANIKVNIEGYGTYQIDSDFVNELLAFISNKNAVRVHREPVREVVDQQFTGKELLNERKT